MPSGSHGGGGHGGGGHSGGGHSYGSRSSGGTPRPRTPRTIRIGNSIFFLSVGKQNAFSFLSTLFMIILMFAIMSGSSLSYRKQDLKLLQEEREGYISMIEKAQTNENLVVDGTVKDVWQGDCGKWYITYKFTASTGEIVDNGYSFCVYSSRAEAPSEHSTIKLAVPSEYTDKNSDSVPMDYIEYGIEKDGDYILAKKSVTQAKWQLSICIVGLTAIILICVITFIKSKQKTPNAYADANNSNSQLGNTIADNRTNCEYCGCAINPTDTKCPSCGARIK